MKVVEFDCIMKKTVVDSVVLAGSLLPLASTAWAKHEADVPDGGATSVLLVLGLAGVAALRKWLK